MKRGRKPKYTSEQLEAMRDSVNTYWLSNCSVARITRHWGISSKQVNELLLSKEDFEKQGVVEEHKLRIVNPASTRHSTQMETLAKFCGLDEIEYIDNGESETYILKKGVKTLKIDAAYNRADGGFLCVDCNLPPARFEDVRKIEEGK